MAFIGITDHGSQRGSVGRAGCLRFLDQITKGLFADNWKDNITHDSIWFLQGRAGDLEQQVLLAGDAFQIVEQLAIDPMLGTCSDVVDGFDEQVYQIIGQCPAAQMHEGCKPSEPGWLRMPAELVGGFGRDPPPITIEFMGKHTVEQTARQLDLPNQLQLRQLVLDTRQAWLARITPQLQKQRRRWLCSRIGPRTVGRIFGRTQQRFQPLSCPLGKTAQDAGAEALIVSMDCGTNDPIDTVGCGHLHRKLATPRLKKRRELIRDHPDGWYLISQPGFEQLGVSDSRFPKSERGPDLSTVPFRGSPQQIQRKVTGHLDDKLPRDLLDDRSICLGGGTGKSSTIPEKCQQYRETQPVGMVLGYNKRPIRRRHKPSFGEIRCIRHTHGWKFHHQDAAFVAAPRLFTKPANCKKCYLAAEEIRGVPMRTMTPLDRRNVKSVSAVATDAHERGKDFLSETEIAALLDAAKAGRHGVRDHLLILAMYRHGLRVSEAIDLRRDDVDLDHARLWVRRLKNGLAVEHPIAGDELRAIKRHLGNRTDALPWLFLSERKQPLTRQSVNYLIATAAERAELPPVHPHMLRHSCGFYLANRGYDLRLIQDYLGHRDPKHTAHYTRVASSRFEGLWR